jgi:hypothetical protein
VGGVFVVLIAGTLAAFVMAILELLWNCRKIAVAEKVQRVSRGSKVCDPEIRRRQRSWPVLYDI